MYCFHTYAHIHESAYIMLHILCLHGCRQTSEIFSHQLHKLSVALADIAELHFVDAPHLLPLITSEDDVPTRSWRRPCECKGDASVSPIPGQTHKDTEKQTEVDNTTITTSAQGRSDELHKDDYAEADATLSLALQHNRYDVLLGFSEGAQMVVRAVVQGALPGSVRGIVLCGSPNMYVRRGECTDKATTQSNAATSHLCTSDPTSHKAPNMTSSASPACHDNTTHHRPLPSSMHHGVVDTCGGTALDASLSPVVEMLSVLPSLHICGEADGIVPCEDSRALARLCGSGATLLTHSGGHLWPHTRAVHDAVRRLCLALQPTPVEQIAAQVTRCDELEMLKGMYGEECVRELDDDDEHYDEAGGEKRTAPHNHRHACVVQLPLFDEEDEGTAAAAPSASLHNRDDCAAAVLRRVAQLQFMLDPLYPAVWPTLQLVMRGGSEDTAALTRRIAKSARAAAAWRRWCAAVVCEGHRYLRSACVLHEPMMVAVYWHLRTQACEATEEMQVWWNALIDALEPAPSSSHTVGDAADHRADEAAETTAWWLRSESDESESPQREDLVRVAEAEVDALLRCDADSTKTTTEPTNRSSVLPRGQVHHSAWATPALLHGLSMSAGGGGAAVLVGCTVHRRDTADGGADWEAECGQEYVFQRRRGPGGGGRSGGRSLSLHHGRAQCGLWMGTGLLPLSRCL